MDLFLKSRNGKSLISSESPKGTKVTLHFLFVICVEEIFLSSKEAHVCDLFGYFCLLVWGFWAFLFLICSFFMVCVGENPRTEQVLGKKKNRASKQTAKR